MRRAVVRRRTGSQLPQTIDAQITEGMIGRNQLEAPRDRLSGEQAVEWIAVDVRQLAGFEDRFPFGRQPMQLKELDLLRNPAS